MSQQPCTCAQRYDELVQAKENMRVIPDWRPCAAHPPGTPEFEAFAAALRGKGIESQTISMRECADSIHLLAHRAEELHLQDVPLEVLFQALSAQGDKASPDTFLAVQFVIAAITFRNLGAELAERIHSEDHANEP
jgi:hypothetical protein